MSFYSKIILVIFLMIALGLPMMMKGPDGKPIMSLDDWIPDVSGVTDSSGGAITGAVEKVQSLTAGDMGADSEALAAEEGPRRLSGGSGKMYKWQDEQGRWHFSSEKPPSTAQASVESLPEVENVMEAPVSEGDNSSTITLPGGFSLGTD